VQFDHHRRAIDALALTVEQEKVFDAVIVTGSVPRGTAREDSDIDCYVLVGTEEYERRREVNDLAYFTGADYPGGYVDGKVVTEGFLEAAADHGSEPTRASFAPAMIVHSRVGDLQPLVDRIGVYPEANRAENMRDFFAAMALHASYFGPQALKTDNPLLLGHAAVNTALFGGRAILAYNRTLFPCPKQLLSTVEQAPEQPDGFADALRRLITSPSESLFASILTSLAGFTDWGITDAQVLTRFMELDEWTWMTGRPELAQR
jgi:Nucleotidyltransferase domain